MTTWTVFPILGNKELGNLLLKRAKELGYGEFISSTRDNYVIPGGFCFDESRQDDRLCWAPVDVAEIISTGVNIQNHIPGNLNDFLYTDKYRRKNPVKVKLNDEYTAEISKNGVKVGCQNFPLSIIDNLVKAREEYSKQ